MGILGIGEEFFVLLAHVRQLARIGMEILSGNIRIEPTKKVRYSLQILPLQRICQFDSRLMTTDTGIFPNWTETQWQTGLTGKEKVMPKDKGAAGSN